LVQRRLASSCAQPFWCDREATGVGTTDAKSKGDAVSKLELNNDQLLRYSRQIMLPDIGIEGQERLWESRVLIVGIGGLGSPVSMYLASSGVGHLTLVDDDVVELSNLQRQIVHTTAALGEPKVESAKRTLRALNPEVTIETVNGRLEDTALLDAVRAADVVVEATDNFSSRFALNQACVNTGTPLVSGAVIRMEGQVSVFCLGQSDSPCYNCLHPRSTTASGTCAENGVLGSVAGIVGAIQATEVVKTLLNIGQTLTGRLLLLDARAMEWHTIKLRRNPKCPTCAVDFEATG
jgi:molybdopterin/thiamine biosynthesis adenylyltransferase